MQKIVYDMRGKATNIRRLAAFDSEGFIHMVFYRILVFVAVAYGVILLLWYAFPALSFEVKFTTALVWILFTPQVFETSRAMVMVPTRGLALGHLNMEYKKSMRAKYHYHAGLFAAIPYIAILVWIGGFVAMLIWWTL